MKIRNLFILGILSSLFIGCANTHELQRLDALRRESAWPQIRADVEMEVARRKGNTDWSHTAYYSPRQHTNGVWVVMASGPYPENTWPLNWSGDNIDVLIRDSGEVISYAPHTYSRY
jgi:hypothetical protein